MDRESQDAVIARFPARLRELREAAGLSQTELGKRANVPQATVAAYEVGRNAPTWGNVVKFADALGVPTDAFRVAPARQDSEQNST